MHLQASKQLVLVQYSLSHVVMETRHSDRQQSQSTQFENSTFVWGSSTWSSQQTRRDQAILSTSTLDTYCQKYIMRAKTGATLLWNQIKPCFIVIYVLHLHKANWSQTLVSSLPLPHYIASLAFSASLVTTPARLRMGESYQQPCISPWHMGKALSKQPNSASKATAAGFRFCFVSGEKLLPPAPGFPRGLHACLTSPSHYAIKAGWSPFWSTISNRYLLSRWNKVVQCSEHRKRIKLLFSTSYRTVTSWPCHAHCIP